MSFSRLSSKMKNEEGSGLILALMTLLVLSVLGASLGAVTIGSYKLGQNTQDDTSAYYIAEAGANMAYEEMKAGVMKVYDKNLPENSFFESEEGVEGVKELINGEGYTFDEQSGEKPTATISIEEVSNSNPRSYIITSKGEVDGKKRTVSKPVEVTYVERNTGIGLPPIPENSALITKGKIEFLNGSIHGNIYQDTIEPKSIILSNSRTVTSNTSNIYNNLSNLEQLYDASTLQEKQIQSFYARTNKLPKSFDFSIYNGFVDSFNSNQDDNTMPTLDVDSFQYSGINDYTYIHSPYNSHDVVNNNNINLNTWMTKDYNLNLSRNTKINNIDLNNTSTLDIKTNSNLSIQDVSIKNNSNMFVGINSNNKTISINDLKLKGSKLILDTNNNDVNLFLNNVEINNEAFQILGTGNVKMVVNNNITLNNGSIILNNTGKTDLFVKKYYHKNGSLILRDKSNLTLSVKNNFLLDSGNINTNGKINNFKLNYYGSTKLEIGGGVSLLGSVYIEKADLKLTGSGNIKGAIISGGANVEVTGGSLNESILISPKARALFSEGGTIKGVLITDELKINGGARIEYKPFNFEDLNYGRPQTPSTPEVDTIISTDPAIEPN